MPELAEVETTRRDLKKILIGKKITKVEVFLDKIVYNKKDYFIKTLEGLYIKDIKRRGKWLIFEFEEKSLIIHFRMEGRFYLKELNDIRDKHDYVIFHFDNFSIHYNDPRLFGKMEIVENKQMPNFFESKKLGVEYTDPNFTSLYLKKKLKGHHIYIKKILLDQSYIAGIGNIYADEILFRSKINPKAYADKLSKNKLEEIVKNTAIVFEESLKCKGTYPNIDGKRGTYEKYLKVYGRSGKKCYECGNELKRVVVSGRGTYYCPYCQK